MDERILPRKSPPSVQRWLWRAPIALYRASLGGRLGERFLLLEHTGRRSGRCARW